MTDTDVRSTPETPDETPIERKLALARKELLETSVRSRLLHTPLGSSRAKIVDIQDELSEEIFRILVRESKPMTFLPTADETAVDEPELLDLAQPGDDTIDPGPAGRHTDSRLQTGLPSTKLQSRLRSIAYDAQTFESEQGVNILYLALGFLKWYEQRDHSKPRYAPLVLIPVTLTRAEAKERFKVAYSGEEISTNLSLQQRLADEGIELPDIPDIEDLSPSAYFNATSAAVAAVPQWEVLKDSITLGFFSFAKLMMYRDLDPELWPLTGALRDHAIINGLLGDGFAGEDNTLIPDDDNTVVDTLIDISTAGHVVDADSSQTLAIDDVRTHHNLVIQGPPGTGKSQTITNLIASAVRDGKRVLFVAEKMAALNVVRSNLERIGLGQICLELHSHKAKKKVVLEELQDTYQLGHLRAPPAGTLASDLRRTRDALNDHATRLHTPLSPSLVTPYEVFGKLARLAAAGVRAPDFQLAAAQGWNRPDAEERQRRVAALAQHVGTMGIPAQHPWRGMGLEALLPQDIQRAGDRATVLSAGVTNLAHDGHLLADKAGTKAANIAEARQLGPVGTFAGLAPALDARALANEVWMNSRQEIENAVQTGTRFSRMKRQLDRVLLPAAWGEDFSDVRRQLAEHGRSWLRWLSAEYRNAVRRLRSFHIGPLPGLSERLAILNTLAAGQRERELLSSFDALGLSAFGSHWSGEHSDWQALQAICEWEKSAAGFVLPAQWRCRFASIGDLAAFSRDIQSFASSAEAIHTELSEFFSQLSFDVQQRFGVDDIASIPFVSLEQILATLATHAARFSEWSVWRVWSHEAKEAGLGEIVDRLDDGRLDQDTAVGAFEMARFESLARQAYAENRELALFDGRTHEASQAAFKRLDREILALSTAELKAQHLERMPRGNRSVGEVGILAREWQKQRRHLPLRQLIKATGRTMQLIKPVWMMSPMSLAQFVTPGAVEFELVLMDEASQIRPIEALGAIARGRQVVVVGDDKQLPPTSFFDRVAGEDSEPVDSEDFRVTDVESILGLCTAQGMPFRMLRWHYRSQHESLIAVSNLAFYKRLYIVPSAESEDLGLRFTKVNGTYDRGQSATNRIEARAVAEAVISHARRYRSSERFPGGMSLGVGTFSVAQRDAILDELELLWRENPDLAPFFSSDTPEPFFVKNLESIQGDERDVVLISVGYGPDHNGFVAMGFGPLSAQGGERRLNVLITRARRRCEVFASITASDIDLGRTQSAGVAVLKTFLRYAEMGYLERADMPARPIDSDFEEDVGSALSQLGYTVEHQVGVAGFFIDMAIKDPEQPGRYLIGIECDGATYHSSRSARDRDRLREQVLVDRGWRIHRIWSTDWFKNRSETLMRAAAAIEAARADDPVPGQATRHSEHREPAEAHGVPVENADPLPNPPAEAVKGPAYVEVSFSVRLTVEPHRVRRSELLPILKRIVDTEGPIHEEEIGRRYASVCGKDRAGARIQQAVRDALVHAVRIGALHVESSFYIAAPVSDCPPRDRSQARSVTLRKPDMLPTIEIRTGLRHVVEEHLGVEPPVAISEVARMFGFQRTGSELERVIEDQVRSMLGEGALVLRNGGRLYLP